MGSITVIANARLNMPYSELVNKITSVHIIDLNNARILFNKALSSKYSDIQDIISIRILQVIIEVIIVLYNENHGGVFEELNYLEQSIDIVSEELGYSIHKKYLDNIVITEDMITLGVEVLQNIGIYDELLLISNNTDDILSITSWDISNSKLLIHLCRLGTTGEHCV